MRTAYKLDDCKDDGLYLMSDKLYFMIDAINQSSLKKFLEREKLYESFSRYPDKPTDAMKLGTLFDTLITGKDTFDKIYMRVPKINRNTNIYKKMVADNPDKVIIFESEMKAPLAMQKSFNEHPQTKEMIKDDGTFQVVALSTCDGKRIKSKADYVDNEKIIDIKSAKDITELGWIYANKDYRYYLQAAFYLYNFSQFLDVKNMYFAMVENHAPHETVYYSYEADFMRDQISKLPGQIDRFSEAKEKKVFKRYSDVVKIPTIPHWALRGTEGAQDGF